MSHDTDSSAAQFDALPDTESRAFLAEHHVGRIAYTFHDRVDIAPIHYVADGDWIYGRTNVGTKLATLAHHPWCAFEVDMVRGVFDWTSVVVHGTFYLIDPMTAGDGYDRALALVRTLVPDAFDANDPAPQRTVLFRIAIGEITGRVARPAMR